MEIRPLRREDAGVAHAATRAALPIPEHSESEDAGRRWHAFFERVLETDPGGCWAAADGDGRIAGCALSLVRDGLWALSCLAVRPEVQAQGIGRRLIDAALTHANGRAPG